MDYRSELGALIPGLEINRYYDAWRLMMVLWRGLWFGSRTDWGRYRLRIWEMFTERVSSAARTAGDMDTFLSRVVRFLNLTGLGTNADDREEVLRILALDDQEKRTILRMLRENASLLAALVRRWRDIHKLEEEQL